MYMGGLTFHVTWCVIQTFFMPVFTLETLKFIFYEGMKFDTEAVYVTNARYLRGLLHCSGELLEFVEPSFPNLSFQTFKVNLLYFNLYLVRPGGQIVD